MTVRRIVRGTLFCLMIGTAWRPSAALADRPIHIGGVDTFSDTLCGIPVLVVDRGEATIHPVNGDPNATMFTNHTTSTYTAANGKSITISGSGQVSETVTTNPDGTLTVVDTVHGLGERIAVPRDGTATRDAGIVTFTTKLDISTDPPTVLESHVIVQADPHPDAGGPIFCQ